MSEEFSTFSLSVKSDEYYLSNPGKLSDPTEIAIRKLEDNTNVQATKQNISVSQNFYFSSTEVRTIYAFFYKQYFYKQRQDEIGNNQANAKQHSQTELLLFENYSNSSSTFSSKSNKIYSKI